MVLYNILANIPIMNTQTPEGLIIKNRIVIVIGTCCYLIAWALLYYQKLPSNILTKLPKIFDPKYVLLFMIFDFILYVFMFKRKYGIYPPLSLNNIKPKNKSEIKNTEEENINNSHHDIEIDDDDNINVQIIKDKDDNYFLPPSPPDEYITDDYIIDDYIDNRDRPSVAGNRDQSSMTGNYDQSSTTENRDRPLMTSDAIDKDDVIITDQDIDLITTDEISMMDKDYFKDNTQTIENWDIEECLPDEYC